MHLFKLASANVLDKQQQTNEEQLPTMNDATINLHANGKPNTNLVQLTLAWCRLVSIQTATQIKERLRMVSEKANGSQKSFNPLHPPRGGSVNGPLRVHS